MSGSRRSAALFRRRGGVFFFDGGSNALRGAGIGGSMPDSMRRPADVQRTRGDWRECVTPIRGTAKRGARAEHPAR